MIYQDWSVIKLRAHDKFCDCHQGCLRLRLALLAETPFAALSNQEQIYTSDSSGTTWSNPPVRHRFEIKITRSSSILSAC